MKPIDPVLLDSLLEQLKQLKIVLQDQHSFTYKWLPSVVGFVSTAVALVVGWLSHLSAKDQIKTSRIIAEKQISSAKEIAKSQLDNAKEITVSQIKANLIAASRKEWIENLRKNITSLFTLVNRMHKNENRSPSDFDEMWRLSAYIELLLNSNEAEHQNFLLKQGRFVAFCIENKTDTKEWVNLKHDYLEAAKVILKQEWNKVKNFH